MRNLTGQYAQLAFTFGELQVYNRKSKIKPKEYWEFSTNPDLRLRDTRR